jgi:histidinol-phosphate aminotransferase
MQRRRFLRLGAAVATAPAVLFVRPDALARAAPVASRPHHRGAGAPRPIKLSQNENPLGMPPAALEAALEATRAGHLYPQRTAELVDALAAHVGVPPDSILLGNGSSEILQAAVQAAAEPGARAVMAEPTYADAERYATPAGMRVIKVPLLADGAHEIERMRAIVESSAAPALVFLCNPNNPTGTLTPCDPIEDWIAAAASNVTFLIDEAYFEFADDAGYRTFAPQAAARANIVVSRTFSKIYGLAGVRLGYGIASGPTFARTRAHIATLNTSTIAQAAGIAALGEREYVQRSLASNAEALRVATRVLDELGLAHMPTHTNFLMHRVRGDVNAHIARMRDAGIIVGRPFPPMLDWNRVSLGTPEEMEEWGVTLRDFRERGWI